MADANKPRYRKLYKPEFDMAAATLADRAGKLEWSGHDYQAFTWTEPKVALVFYPHRTSAGNYHLRVRDQGSVDKKLAERLMTLLDDAAGLCCTFGSKLNLGGRK